MVAGNQLNAKQSYLLGAFLKVDMRHGHLSAIGYGYFLNLTGDMGVNVISDMRQGHFTLIFLFFYFFFCINYLSYMKTSSDSVYIIITLQVHIHLWSRHSHDNDNI